MYKRTTGADATSRGICMSGNIYCRQKCSICERAMTRHDFKRQCFTCPDHKNQIATSNYYVKFKGEVHYKKDYNEAIQLLHSMRKDVSDNNFDNRDYQKDSDLALSKVVQVYLDEVVEDRDKVKHPRSMRRHLASFLSYFGSDINVKKIKGEQIVEWLDSEETWGKKAKANAKSTASAMYTWLASKKKKIRLDQIPHFPKVDPGKAKLRQVISSQEQNLILREIARNYWESNPKLVLAYNILVHFPSLRPGDLRKIREKDFDLDTGVMAINEPTKSNDEWKTVRLLPEQIKQVFELKRKYPAEPNQLFFTHCQDVCFTAKKGQPIGKNYMRRKWRAVADAMGFKHIQFYAAVRHSTITALSKSHGKAAAMQASNHKWSKSFERYCIGDGTAEQNFAYMINETAYRDSLSTLKKISKEEKKASLLGKKRSNWCLNNLSTNYAPIFSGYTFDEVTGNIG